MQTVTQRQQQTPPDSSQSAEEDEEDLEWDEDLEDQSLNEDKEEQEDETPAEPPIRALSSAEQIGVQGGLTPLHYAARQGHLESAEILLDNGADIDQVTGGD